MRGLSLLVSMGVWLAPVAALAAKVAIVPVEYVQVETGERALDAAKQVEEKVAEGAAQAGYEVVRGQAVADALGATPACAAARDRACLEALAETLGVDEAIAVSVSDDEHTSYKIELIHARRDKVVDERTAGFFVVLEWVRGTVALTLQKPAAAAPEPVADDLRSQPSPEPQPSEPGPAAPEPEPRPRPLHRAIFWTGVGVTGALVVAFAATDIAVNARYNDLKDESPSARTDAEWDDAHRLQVADRALLGVALAAAAATTVIYFFTDFEGAAPSAEGSAPLSPPEVGGKGGQGKQRVEPVVGVAPYALPNGGGLVLEGRF